MPRFLPHSLDAVASLLRQRRRALPRTLVSVALARAALAAVLALGACGDSGVGAAREALARGDLETASAGIAAAQGSAAELVRADIARVRAEREEAQALAERCLEQARAGEKSAALEELRRARARFSDAGARETIERASSQVGDVVVAKSGKKPREAEAAVATSVETAPLGLVERSIEQARLAAASGDWRRASSLAEVAAGSGEQTGLALRAEIEEAALAAWRRKLSDARALSARGAEREAFQLIETALTSFPSSYVELREEFAGAPPKPAAFAAGTSGDAPEATTFSGTDLVNGTERLRFRDELARALAARPQDFAELKLQVVDAEGIVVDRVRSSWDVVPRLFLRDVERLVPRAARLGAIAERMARMDAQAWRDLAAAVDRGEIAAQDAFEILAAERGEPVPSGGYVFVDDEWRNAGVEAETEADLLARLAAAERDLLRSRPANRAAAIETLRAFGERGRSALEGALAKLHEDLVRSVEKGGTLGQLERLAEARRELDLRREQALALIFDEAEYFYPYNVPECPPEKAKLYPAVQRRVDELVAAVAAAWDESRKVRLPEPFLGALAELAELERSRAELSAPAFAPHELPPWLAGLPPGETEVDLRSFAWTAAEQQDLAYGRAVLRFNEHTWKESANSGLPAIAVPSNDECDQVRATNEYRAMFGRRPLVWNAKLQVAAQEHSDWMSLTGKYAHENDEDPERRTPFDRMRLAGYDRGVSENLSRGRSGPREAHDGWRQSSGHHRNLIMPGHREMASAQAGALWTQNFGASTDFLETLKPWFD